MYPTYPLIPRKGDLPPVPAEFFPNREISKLGYALIFAVWALLVFIAVSYRKKSLLADEKSLFAREMNEVIETCYVDKFSPRIALYDGSRYRFTIVSTTRGTKRNLDAWVGEGFTVKKEKNSRVMVFSKDTTKIKVVFGYQFEKTSNF